MVRAMICRGALLQWKDQKMATDIGKNEVFAITFSTFYDHLKVFKILYNYIDYNLVLVPRKGPVKRPQLRNTILLGRINMLTSTDSSSGPPLSFFYFSMSSTGSTSTFMIYWKSDFQTIMIQPQCNNKFWSMMIVMSHKSQSKVLVSI